MLFDNSYFALNSQKEKPDFSFTSVINGINGLNLDDKPQTAALTTEDQKPTTPSLFSWGVNDSRPKWDEPGTGWSFPSLPENTQHELTLEELSAAHLENHETSKWDRDSGIGASSTNSEPNTPTAEEDTAEEFIRNRETKEVNGNRENSLVVERPSSFGHVLCKKSKAKRTVVSDVQNSLICPPEIQPFKFLAPSPDDIVREKQNGQKKFFTRK